MKHETSINFGGGAGVVCGGWSVSVCLLCVALVSRAWMRSCGRVPGKSPDEPGAAVRGAWHTATDFLIAIGRARSASGPLASTVRNIASVANASRKQARFLFRLVTTTRYPRHSYQHYGAGRCRPPPVPPRPPRPPPVTAFWCSARPSLYRATCTPRSTRS